jgi:hypothetical protein
MCKISHPEIVETEYQFPYRTELVRARFSDSGFPHDGKSISHLGSIDFVAHSLPDFWLWVFLRKFAVLEAPGLELSALAIPRF